MTIIFGGTIGRSGLGGQAWAILQYLLGFRALGHDVYYLEDCGDSSWIYIWEKDEWTDELDYPAAYVNACLAPFGFGERWIYRDYDQTRGMTLPQFLEVCGRADLLELLDIGALATQPGDLFGQPIVHVEEWVMPN